MNSSEFNIAESHIHLTRAYMLTIFACLIYRIDGMSPTFCVMVVAAVIELICVCVHSRRSHG